MKISVLGIGCLKCRLFKASAAEAATALLQTADSEIEMEEVTDLDIVREMGMLVSPGLAVEDGLLQAGKVLSAEHIRDLLKKQVEGRL